MTDLPDTVTASGLHLPPGTPVPTEAPPKLERVQAIGFRAQPTTMVLRTKGKPDEHAPAMNLDFVGPDGQTIVASLTWIAQPEQMRDARRVFGAVIDDALTMARRRRKVAR